MVNDRVIDQLVETANNAIGRVEANLSNIEARVHNVPYNDAKYILAHYNESFSHAVDTIRDMREYLESLQ